VTFSGTTRRWEFNYQHWACIDWKQPDIKLRVEGLATNANRRYASQQRWGHNGAACLLSSVSTGDEGVAEDLATLFTFNRRAVRPSVVNSLARRRPILPMPVVLHPLLWPYICTIDSLELPADGRKETHFDARMDVDVYHDVAMGSRDRGDGRRCRPDRRHRVKPGVWVFAGGLRFDIHTARPRVTNTAGPTLKRSTK
jgi:hypothetical protein